MYTEKQIKQTFRYKQVQTDCGVNFTPEHFSPSKID